jgi:hypothetical protein
MVIIETSYAYGMVVGFVEKNSGELKYLFRNCVFYKDAFHVQGTSIYGGITAEFNLLIAGDLSAVTGNIRDVRTAENVTYSGKMLRSPHEFTTDAGPPGPLTTQQVEGVYSGTVDGHAGKLIVKDIGEYGLAARFKSDDDSLDLRFQKGRYIGRIGILSTVNILDDASSAKLVLGYRSSDAGEKSFKGFVYGMKVNSVFEATFKRIGDVQDFPDLQDL